MSWRLARALETLRSQVNTKWPKRSKASDGAVGDTSHSARPSDHNPDANGVVKAVDITHDPKGGFDSYAFADTLLRNKDPRIKYVISNGRIGSGAAGPSPWKWRKYSGSNPHNHHVHISVVPDKGKYDDMSPWQLAGLPLVDPAAAKEFVRPPATLAPGASGADVERLQKWLGCAVTGKYEARSETEFALRLFQVRHKLEPDGKAGPQTWAALNKLNQLD